MTADTIRSERQTRFQELVPAITTALGTVTEWTWSLLPGDPYDAPHYTRVIAGPYRLNFNLDAYAGRIAISGMYGNMPDGTSWFPSASGKYHNPRIGVSVDRDAAAIAREIARRLLPDYYACYAQYESDHARDLDYRGTCARIANHLQIKSGNRAIVREPSQYRSDDGSRELSIASDTVPGIDYGTIKIYAADSVKIDVSVSPEFAERFATLLASL